MASQHAKFKPINVVNRLSSPKVPCQIFGIGPLNSNMRIKKDIKSSFHSFYDNILFAKYPQDLINTREVIDVRNGYYTLPVVNILIYIRATESHCGDFNII